MPFAAVLATRLRGWIGRNLVLAGVTILTAILVSSFLEWHFYVSDAFFAGQGYALPGYSRMSLSLSAVALTLAFERLGSVPPPLIILMSRYSLALYCIHPFFLFSVPEAPSDLSSSYAMAFKAIVLALLILSSYLTARALKVILQGSILF